MSYVRKVDGVKQLHNLLIASFAETVLGELSIRPTAGIGSAWEKSSSRGPVIFELISDIGAVSAAPHRMHAPISPLKVVDEFTFEGARGWVSWMEKWNKHEGTSNLELESVGFTFYWGNAWEIDSILFRAEWDQDGHGAKNAGHPHWQLSGAASRVHFGMAGWRCHEEQSKCWQHYPANDQDLRGWATRTLEYSCGQLNLYQPFVG